MRTYFLDRIRVILTILVIAHHSAITYGASGGWFVRLAPGDGPTAMALTLFCAVNQAFFMGFFFLISGYLTPSSYDRKGWADYLRDRLLRLGLPVLVFGFVLGPLTVAIAADGSGFLTRWLTMMSELRFVIGPMWFAYALLVFAIGYVLWRRFVPIRPKPRQPIPAQRMWIISALAVGLAALVIRQFVPVGEEVLNLQLGYFASYVFLFAVGCIAERYGWLEEIKQRHAQPWVIAGVVAIPLLPLALMVGEAMGQTNFATGFSLPAIFYAFWEPVVAWGVIAGALWIFPMWWGERDRRWGFLSRQSYAAFIIHPPVIVTLALLMQPLPLPLIVKFLVLTLGGTVLCFSFAWAIRKVPFVGRVI
ncbi:acyltransferase family protein [Rhizobium sp.]